MQTREARPCWPRCVLMYTNREHSWLLLRPHIKLHRLSPPRPDRYTFSLSVTFMQRQGRAHARSASRRGRCHSGPALCSVRHLFRCRQGGTHATPRLHEFLSLQFGVQSSHTMRSPATLLRGHPENTAERVAAAEPRLPRHAKPRRHMSPPFTPGKKVIFCFNVSTVPSKRRRT